MFVTLLIGGRDHGQLRPGLAEAEAERTAQEAVAEAQGDIETGVVQASFTPEENLPAAVEPSADAVSGELNLPLIEAAVEEAVTEPAAAPKTEEAEPAEDGKTVAYVTASSVNVRDGPGTTFGVLGRLERGDAATVVWTDDTGWARIRIEGDGIEGFVSADYLSATAP